MTTGVSQAPSKEGKENYKAPEVARMLTVSERTIIRMATAREIPSFQVRGEWRFPKKLIDAMYSKALETGEFA